MRDTYQLIKFVTSLCSIEWTTELKQALDTLQIELEKSEYLEIDLNHVS